MKLKWMSDAGKAIRVALPILGLSMPLLVQAGWQQVWNDEFDGTSVNSSRWTFDIGNGSGGWGNNELEYYTSRPQNVFVTNGILHIVARNEVPQYNGFDYTSAKLKTSGRFSQKYGRFEFRARLPQGQGYWPALWMMPASSVYGGWAASGEIDIMENKGSNPTTTGGTIHYGGSWPNNVYSGSSYTFPSGGVATDFHTYMLEWGTNYMKWYVDGVAYQTQTSWWSSGGPYPAPFDQPFYLIMNLAVGGNYGGNPNGSTVFPGEMQVDYVRVYEFVASKPDAPTGLTVSCGDGKVYLNWDASSTGATGYKVKRATSSGGTYTTVASPVANSFTDTTVANCSTYYYVVSATNSLGESADSVEQTAALGSYFKAVSSGGGATNEFAADSGFSGGTQAGAATAAIDTSGLEDPAPQAVYQTERYGNFTYVFSGLTSGLNYLVRLHFAETYWTSVGQRRFNVRINGQQVLTNFDIIAVTGAPNKATIQEFTSSAVNGQIIIQFTTVTDNAKCDGIEILLPQPATPTAGNNGPLWSGMTLNLTASSVPGATYNWSGPNGFTSTAQNPTVLNAAIGNSGEYRVTTTVGGCSSPPATTLVTLNPPPNVIAQFLAGNVVLTWPVGTLQSATNVSGPWGDVSGATSPLTNPAVSSQGFYRLRLP